MPRILYPIWTQPVLTPEQRPEQVTESRWHQPLSEPVRWRGLIAAVVATTTLFGPSFVPNPVPPPSVAGWHGQISQPTLWKGQHPATRGALSLHPLPITVAEYLWQQPFSQPTLRKSTVQPDALSWAYFTPVVAETVTIDKWYAPFAQPTTTRKATVQPDALSWSYFTPAAAETVTVDKWLAPFSRPMLPRPAALGALSLHPLPVTVEAYRWQQPFSEPTRRKADNQPAALVWSGFTPALSTGWIPALSEPTRAKPRIQPDALSLGYFTPPSGTPGTDDVRFASSQTIVPYSRTLLYQSIAYPVPIVVAGETVTVDKWFASLAQPTQRKVNNQPAAVTFHPLPITVEAYRWQQPLSEPVRAKPTVHPAALTFHPFPVTVAEYRWQQPLAEPTRRVWPAAQQPALFFVGPDVAVNKWLVPLSEPTRRKPTVQPDALNWSYTTPALATDWVGPLSQPTYRIRLAEYPAFSWSTFTPTFFPGDATSLQTDWFNQLQQPTRLPWSPSTWTFFWLAPSGEPGPTPVTAAPAQPGGYWYEKWEELARLSRRCKDDDECREAFAEAVEATEAVLATIEANASLGRLKKAIARAAEARDLAYALRCCENIRKELTKLNAELMQARAEADEEEEEAIALLLLH